MKKTSTIFLFLFVLFFFISHGTFADLSVIYLSGDCAVDLHGNGEWTEVFIDMDLNERSVVRTGPDGMMELLVDDSIISIGAGSELSVSDLKGRMQDKRKRGWMKSISKYTLSFGKGDERYGKTALAGIRGEKQDESSIEWFEESEDTTADLERAKGLVSEGRYREAIPILEDLVAYEEQGPFRSEAGYFLGIAMYQNFQYREADTHLTNAITQKDAYYYESALMHYAILHYLLNDYDRTISALSRYTKEFPHGDLIPFALFMLGKSYRETGNTAKAKSYFLEVRDKYADSEVYSDAVEEIASL